MRVLVLGRDGQVARALAAIAPAAYTVACWGREQLDLTRLEDIAPAIAGWRPHCIINASAYTAVDRAESEREAAFRLNADAVGEIAAAAADLDCRLLHISTDFVFDGTRSTPYTIDARCRPLGVYGASKRAGEEALLSRLPAAAIIRTAWVYSPGGSNFLLTMLRLMRERDSLNVVCDQVGTPTAATSLAAMLWRLVEAESCAGIWHYTDAGVASWYDFACAIQEEALAQGLLTRAVPIHPIPTSAYPTPAQRPPYSVLDCTETWRRLGIMPRHWQSVLRQELAALRHNSEQCHGT